MKKHIMLIGAAFIVFVSTASYAHNYYTCDSTGDDNNAGTISAPFKTFGKAMKSYGKLQGGDSILFCRGGVFTKLAANAAYFNFNAKRTLNDTITIADYSLPGAAGNEAAPVIHSSGHALYFNSYAKVLADIEGGIIIKNLTLMGTGVGDGIFTLNGVSNILIDNVTIENFKVGVEIAGTTGLRSHRITLKNSKIINNMEQGFLGGGYDIRIEDNYFENNGGGTHPDASYFYHNIYVGGPTSGDFSGPVTIRGNTLYRSAMIDGKCGGASLVVHGKQKDVLIEKNLIKEDKGKVSGYCYGLGVGPAYPGPEEFENVTIRNNKIINVGATGISTGSVINGLVENNLIVDQAHSTYRGINISENNPSAGDATSQNIRVIGNKIYLGDTENLGILVGSDGGSTAPVTVTDNVISFKKGTTGKCISGAASTVQIIKSGNTCTDHENADFINPVTGESRKNILK